MDFMPERKTVLLWQARVALICLILSAFSVFFCRYGLFFLIFAAAVLFFGVLVIFWYLPLFFKSYTVRVTENAVIVERGVLFRVSRIMPFKRLVFAGSYETPISRIMRLKGVILRAARARLFIPEIYDIYAEKLIFSLSSGGERDE